MSSSTPNITFVRDPSRSGFFMQRSGSSGSSGLTWIEDPSTSGFFMEARAESPAAPRQSVSKPRAAAGAENSHPLLIHTYKAGYKQKIFKDKLGWYIAYRPNPADEEEWLRTRTRMLGLPQSLTSTQIVNVQLSTTYAELKKQIDAQVPEEENRFGTIALSGRPSIEKVKLQDEKGYTLINEDNCKTSLELVAARGWKDILVAVYENV
ncbi:hypothetical protein N431DRAFT_502661 [Stipitochalara longipes BDJ]|nr:hypothetical protein N431DRAFT_502661 [Stipitochalara longipes BDJ]